MNLNSNVLTAIKKLWKNDVQSKVNVFGWRLLLDRLPTKMALNHKGILLNSHDLLCVFCFLFNEDCAHLFFLCSFSKGVLEAVYNWVGKSLPISVVGWNHFLLFGDMIKTKKGGCVNHLIWLATSWSIWKLRNNVIFNGFIPNTTSLVDDVKVCSWVWFNNR
ncbi:unnamed protein product [Trifolium pratense]|uniref:Uncharacterized protein n=1 Tax=Trifolium pratense TaxID=57577 RepID=A0ACB0LZ54_TRIPR|nr:unnamed protein product [Trifolium pratense]